MRDTRTIALVTALWLATFVVDVVLLPRGNYPIVYAVPVVIAATRASPRFVLVTAAVVVLTDLLDVYVAQTPLGVWLFNLFSLVMICLMGFWIAGIRQRLAQYASDQHGIARAAEALIQTQTLGEAAGAISEQAQHVLGVSAVQLWEADCQQREWHLIAARGISPETTERLRHLPFDEATLLTHVLESDRALQVPDVSTLQGNFVMASTIFARERVCSALIQPLSVRGMVIGAVSYLERAPRRFSAGEQDRIEPLGNLWALAIENAHLHDSALRSAREAEAAREQLQRFLALVVHDLRNPLTTILGFSQLLIRQPAVRQSPVVSDHLRAIERACLQMQRLVRDLLDASRIGAGHFQVEPEPMDLAALVRRTVEQVRANNATRSVILEAPEHLAGVWDPIRLSQVLENLLSNALKYSPSECEVEVRLTREGNEAHLSVTDHGAGISPEQIQALFQPFSRPIQNREARGIGLGLYISKGIVEAMHGRIWVESEVGKGSTFYVALPIRK